MFSGLFRAFLLTGCLWSSLLHAQVIEDNGADAAAAEALDLEAVPAVTRSGWSAALEDGRSIPVEFWGTFATITTIGIRNWDWGTSGFHVESEGWFSYDTGSGGNDKLGHAFMTYSFTNSFSEALIAKNVPRARAAASGALLSQVLGMYVETFDGFSEDHGFAGEDVVFNLAGTTLAYLRQANPGLGELIDYRMEYMPSGYKGFNPISDYAGMKFLVAFKLGGIDRLRDSPLRFVELQGGYFTRGFTSAERSDGIRLTRNDYIGVGINLNEVFLGRKKPAEPFVRRNVRYLLEHYQVPFTAATHHRRI